MHDSVGTAICKVTTSKFTAKLLLLSHLENYIKLTFVVVSQHIFGQAVLRTLSCCARGQLRSLAWTDAGTASMASSAVQASCFR